MNRSLLIGLGAVMVGGGLWYWYDQKKKAEMVFTPEQVVTPEEPGMGLGTPRPTLYIKPGVIQAGQAALRATSLLYR